MLGWSLAMWVVRRVCRSAAKSQYSQTCVFRLGVVWREAGLVGGWGLGGGGGLGCGGVEVWGPGDGRWVDVEAVVCWCRVVPQAARSVASLGRSAARSSWASILVPLMTV